MRRYLLGMTMGLLGLIAVGGSAQAMDSSACPKAPMRVIVMGDSLADGLWASLKRFYAQCGTMKVIRLTAVSDGLAKTSDRDWIQRYLRQAGEPKDRTKDVFVVQIGANDITAIRNGRSRESFNTAEWNSLYTQRVATLTKVLGDRSAEVLWFGLPVVGNLNWEPSYQIISRLQANAVMRAGGKFIDIHRLTQFGTGTFSMNGNVNGRIMQLRAPDKVHFTKPGYDYVASVAVSEIAKAIANTNRQIALQDVELQ